MKLAAFSAALAAIALVLGHSPLSAQIAGDSPLGKTNISSYLSEIPPLPANTSDAARRSFGTDYQNPDYSTLDRFYQPYVDRVEAVIDIYKQYYIQRNEAYYATQNEASIRNQMVEQMDQNPILNGMGGAEAVMQMTPEQAEAAALQAAAAFTADPFAAGGGQSAGMTALNQKVVSDPDYAARFQKMSEKEREAELRKFMANDKPVAKTPEQMEQEKQRRQQQTEQADKVRAAMAVQEQITAFTVKMQEPQIRFGEGQAAVRAAPGNHREIENNFKVKYAAIPEIVLGEGREKDPVQVQKLMAEAAAKHRDFAAKVLAQDQILFANFQADCQRIVAEYAEYFVAHRHEFNGDLADQLKGLETETMVANFEMSLIGLGLDFVNKAKEITREAGSWERQ